MIPGYRLLSERIEAELTEIERLVSRAEAALARAKEHPADQDYFMASAALDMHGFYAGLERLFELIAREIDGSQLSGAHWHRDLLAQMALEVAGLRPAVLTPEARRALTEYLEFRHVVRNVYTFNLRPDRVVELTRDLRPAFESARRDLLAFTDFLDTLATADE